MAEDRAGTAADSAHPATGSGVKRIRWRQRLAWLVAVLLVLATVAYLAVPPVLKSVLQEQAGKALQRDLQVGRVEFNPFALSLRITEASLRDHSGREVAGFGELFVNLSAASLFKAALVVDELRLQAPRLSLIRLSEGRYDISDLLDQWLQPKDEPDSGVPRFSLNNIQIADGRLTLDDQLKGRMHQVAGLRLGIPFLSSLPYQAEIFVEPAFAAEFNGSRIDLKGRSKPFANSRQSELDLDLDGFDLSGVQAYLPDGLPFRLVSGVLDSELKLVFSESADQVYSLGLSGALHLTKFALEERSGRPLLGWQRLDVEVERVDPLNLEFVLGLVKLTAPTVHATVDRQGRLNWLQLVPPAAGGKAAASAPGQPLRWSVGSVLLREGLVHWRDESNAPAVQGELQGLELAVGRLDHRLAEPLAISELSFRPQFGSALQSGPVSLSNLRIDLVGQRIQIGELRNSQTRIAVLRNAQGQLSWLSPPQLANPPARPAATGKASAEKPWQAQLAKLVIDDLAVRFEDRSGKLTSIQEIDGLSLHGENLGNEPGRKGRIALKARVNRKGSLGVEGSVQAQPLDLALKLEAQALPLMPLQAYFDEHLNVAVTRGQVSAKGEATVRETKGTVQAGYRGALTLGDFLAVDRVNNADFLKWKSLYFGGVDFRAQPLAIEVGEIALSDFYSRLILDAQGQLNLQQIVRKPASDNPQQVVPTTSVQPVARAEEAGGKSAPLPIKIAKVSLQNGTVNFSDYFVKPNYSVNIGKLGGRVTGLSSQDGSVAELDLRGAYANAAPVRIEGRLNPLAANPYLDLKAEVTGVDLVGFSPYAGKYAGYAIEKGKLSLNVAYKLENRQLSADNRLFIDQLTFGQPVESPDATKLPVNLALALLKNSRGEIDLNLPISGSLDDPQFSIGGLVVKVIVNLFVKAVTSPFALLGSIFGGGEELSTVDFAPGQNSLSSDSQKKLSALARALQDRSGLKLEILGRADPEADREGLKRVAIERLMKAEKARELQKKMGEGRSIDNIEIADNEYPRYLQRVYRDARFPKPRNLIGLQKDLPVEEMEKLLLTHLPASDDDLALLASRRAEVVQAWLVDKGAPVERIFMLPPKVATGKDGMRAPGVEFALK
ncbi:DUF748 domain-containing protein [Dechloromonas sp. ZY10]|uniref:DUF748 domain-containing protein n=1 Tax=Dechloromonas aquae TaxID=2664436 RepID=UPI003526CF9A